MRASIPPVPTVRQILTIVGSSIVVPLSVKCGVRGIRLNDVHRGPVSQMASGVWVCTPTPRDRAVDLAFDGANCV